MIDEPIDKPNNTNIAIINPALYPTKINCILHSIKLLFLNIPQAATIAKNNKIKQVPNNPQANPPRESESNLRSPASSITKTKL